MHGSSRSQTEIGHALGLHLRVASQFVRLSQQFQSEIRVFCNGRAANGKSVLDLITLGAGCGACLEIEINGPDADDAIATLCSLVEERSNEDDADRKAS
jgi:phosphocarrier protein